MRMRRREKGKNLGEQIGLDNWADGGAHCGGGDENRDGRAGLNSGLTC